MSSCKWQKLNSNNLHQLKLLAYTKTVELQLSQAQLDLELKEVSEHYAEHVFIFHPVLFWGLFLPKSSHVMQIELPDIMPTSLLG